jgi:L-alanine-DL-glutamate epimerase-like enolase superfamily enzyme
MSLIADLHFRKVIRPLKTVFATSCGMKRQMASILVEIILDSGAVGVGEVPTSLSFSREGVEAIGRTLREMRRRLTGVTIDEWGRWVREFREEYPDMRMTVSGLEIALFRACLTDRGISEFAYWGASEDRLETDITIPLSDDRSTTEKWIRAAASGGFRQYKLKVSGKQERDERLLSTVYPLLRAEVPRFEVRLDGNQGYSPSTLLYFLDYIEKKGYPVALFEQPLPKDDFRGYEEIMKSRTIPVFLDESVCTVSDAARAIDNGLCDGINIKTAKSGILESGAIVDLALRAGKGLMIGCMIETMTGLSSAAFLAAGTGVFDAVDLDSVLFLYGPNLYPGVAVSGPVITIV